MSPIVFVNVLDSDTHNLSKTETVEGIKNTPYKVTGAVLLDTMKVEAKVTAAEPDDPPEKVLLVKDTDYKVEQESTGVTITILNKNKVEEDTVYLTYKTLEASHVSNNDVIGGIDNATEKRTGLETITDIFPKFRIPPGIIIAPKYSSNVSVAAVMKAKTYNINGVFNAIAIVDIPTETVKNYTEAVAYKNDNNLIDSNLIVCYPKVSLGGVQFYLSTQMASLMNKVDNEQGRDTPYVSPSNKNLQCDSTVMADGKEKVYGLDQANLLNSGGIVTAINFTNGWVLWGNRTSANTTDVKDTFISVRRMFNWLSDTLILS